MSTIQRFLVIACGAVVALAGCSDGGTIADPPPPEPVAVVEVTAPGSSLPVGQSLQLTATPRSASGQPLQGRVVEWSSSAEAVASVSTSGLVQAVAPGTATIRASSGGRVGSVAIVVREPGESRAEYTVLVYLAADNNLTWAGVKDIDEMEKVGSSDQVNIVVQAEFSRTYTRQAGCTPGCFNRNNYNTFRYWVPRGDSKRGPDGPVIDIGNRDMTDPDELVDFIRWGKENYPADKYVLVLWNHGGGYHGLIEDETSAGHRLMSLADLRRGLVAADTRFEIIDFDMCLMGAAETLVSIGEFANYVVFSQELVPGDGNPYDRVLARLRATPTMTGSDAATVFVDEFIGSYRNGRNSATKSAVDMQRFGAFLGAWNALAAELETNLETHHAALAAAVPASQGYAYPYLRDLGDFLSRLEQGSSDAGLRQRAGALRAQLNGGLIVRNGFTNGTGNQQPRVDRSTGLNVLLPSNAATDALPGSGPGSFANYRGLYPELGWTGFLQKWLSGGSTLDMIDQGDDTFQAALIWDPDAVETGADLDFWVYEPNGNLYIPWMGVITPNGTFSGDSYETGNYFEVYQTKRFVEAGLYIFFAELYADPQNVRPRYDLLYRFSPAQEFRSYFEPSFPRLSKQTRWADDPGFSWDKVFDEAYTDLRVITWWNSDPAAQSAARSAVAPGIATRGVGTRAPQLPRAQRDRLHQLLRDPAVQAQRAERKAEAARRPVRSTPPRGVQPRAERLRGGLRPEAQQP